MGGGAAAGRGGEGLQEIAFPLVPADCDLRGYKMMLDGERLFRSEFNSISSDSEWRTGVTLWVSSMEEVPAGSLPAEDGRLATLARVDIRKWHRVKFGALRGWVKCSADGRLYHRVVAEVALDGWVSRNKWRKSSAIAAQKKNQVGPDPAQFERSIGTAKAALLALKECKNLSEFPALFAQSLEKSTSIGSTIGVTIGATDGVTVDGTGGEPPAPPSVQPSAHQGEGEGSTLRPKGLNAANAAPNTPADPKAALFAEGKSLLGASAGGLITQLLEVCAGNVRKASFVLGDAAKQVEPRSWLMAAIRTRAKPNQDVWGMAGEM